ncbi:1-deoxyxylulose-5-phosphate synthase YajO [Geodia barretti]|uniref:1-deoxyxylulose-5-phosphate synthase YajO n=1 Tax=Geodia barretti TaxID=519541 RepID=A0AA35VVP5_GEOBA|nr:1-deoxyxylulose-5-phosphate synthase YajO [Geodia barretti]
MAGAVHLPYRYLGKSGLKVSSLCLGTMTFGQQEGCRPGQSNEVLSHQLLDQYIGAGGNFIDTADIYQHGLSERIIGQYFVKRPELRSKMIIATKVFGPMERDDVNARGLSRHHIMQAAEQSLHRLNSDYIDLYQVHCWDDGTPLEETLRALNDLVVCGKVRYVGVSNVTGWQFQKIIDMGRQLGLNQIVSNQAQYNLLCRSTEWEIMEVCKREGVACLPWSPLKGGLLTGKFQRDREISEDPESSRVAWVEADKSRSNQSHPSLQQWADREMFWGLTDTLGDIAVAHEASVAQVAIAWLLHKPTVASVVIGARNAAQLNDNLQAANLRLSQDELDLLDKKSEIELPYPYEMVFRMQRGRERDT